MTELSTEAKAELYRWTADCLRHLQGVGAALSVFDPRIRELQARVDGIELLPEETPVGRTLAAALWRIVDIMEVNAEACVAVLALADLLASDPATLEACRALPPEMPEADAAGVM